MKDAERQRRPGLALQCLLEGEATLVMIKAALADLPGGGRVGRGADRAALSAGSLEKANAPKDVPAYFTEQLFFPYVEGTAYVRRAVKKGGWAGVDRLWKSPPALERRDPASGPSDASRRREPSVRRRDVAARQGDRSLRGHARRVGPSLPPAPRRSPRAEADRAAAGVARRPHRFFAGRADASPTSGGSAWTRPGRRSASSRLSRSRGKTNARARPRVERREAGSDLVLGERNAVRANLGR